MRIAFPELCLVLLVGPSGAGKSTFARAHFLPTEVVSSDRCRAMLADDENDQSVTPDAFELLHAIVAKRLQLGRLTVVDATNVQADARKSLIALAKQYHVACVAIVFDLPEAVLLERHAGRGDRDFGEEVIHAHLADLRRALPSLKHERYRSIHVFQTPDEVAAATLVRTRLRSNLRHESGPFDIIGDVHGCMDELLTLLHRLGYGVRAADGGFALTPAQGRRLVFVGDLVDRGPDSPGVLRLVQSAVAAGLAFCVAGNHDDKLARALAGRKVKVAHGLERSLEQMAGESEAFRAQAQAFLGGLQHHYVFDAGRLVVAHAGLIEALQGRSSGRVRSFALYGDTTGETDAFGLPVRANWAERYRGKALVVYGHTPVVEAQWLNNTVCIDTGCVFGGALTALRYPECELVSVPAARAYYPHSGPFGQPLAGT